MRLQPPSLRRIPEGAGDFLGNLPVTQPNVAAHVCWQAIQMLALPPHPKDALEKAELQRWGTGRHNLGDGPGEWGVLSEMGHGVSFQGL
jgi:hypothetical protein